MTPFFCTPSCFFWHTIRCLGGGVSGYVVSDEHVMCASVYVLGCWVLVNEPG